MRNEVELLEIEQSVKREGETWVFQITVRFAGRARQSLGWGSTLEEARERAVVEAIRLTPEAKELLEGLLQEGEAPRPAPSQGVEEGEASRPRGGKEGPVAGDGKGEEREGPSPRPSPKAVPPADFAKTLHRLVESLESRNKGAFYWALEALGLRDRKDLEALAYPKTEEEVAEAKRVYGVLRRLHQRLLEGPISKEEVRGMVEAK